MATSQMSEVIHHLRRAVLLGDGAGQTDGQLLEDYISRHDRAALEALVWRHGPMVWGVCRRVLNNHHDAEDAFQATFLVLIRRAASIASRELLANWLYGVAHQTALKARQTAGKRRTRERQVKEMPETAMVEQAPRHDLQPLLDQELSRLPDRYRIPIVLCDLEGKTRKEAARQLGVPEGTVAGRLTRARAMLAKRLARHGLALGCGTLAAVLSQKAASASVPSSVMSSTIKAVTLVAAGQAGAGVISAPVGALAEGVMKAMLLMKLKAAGAVLCVMLGLVAVGGGWFTRQTAAAQKDGEKIANSKPDHPKAAFPPNETPKQSTLSLLEKILELLTPPPMPPEPPVIPLPIVEPPVGPPPVPPEPPAIPPAPAVEEGIRKVVDGSVAQPKPVDLPAEQIVERMAKAYKDCKSYRDTGIVKTLFVEAGGNRTVEKPFTTAFVRPDRFRFEYKETIGDQKMRFIIWSNGKEVQTWWDVKPGIDKPKSLDLALGGAAGVSDYSSLNIPQLLMPDKMGWRRLALTEPKRTKDGKLDKVECFRVEGKYGRNPITLWIDKRTYLVRRIDEQAKFDNFRTEQTTTYDPTIDKKITDKTLDFDPPVPK